MGWRDQLQPGSLRGVAFHMMDDRTQVGRRAVTHEFPGREKGFTEDLGRRSREITLEAVVIGADYMAQRDALINAAETPGPAALVHPYFGRMQVMVLRANINQSPGRGGMARITLTVVETDGLSFPTVTRDTAAGVRARSVAAIGVAKGQFSQSFVAGSVDLASGFLDVLEASLGNLAGAADNTDATTSRSRLMAGIAQARSTIAQMMASPLLLADTVADLLSDLRQTGPAAEAGFDAVQRLSGYAAPTLPTPTTPTRQQEADNQVAFEALVRQVATIESATAAADITPSNRTDALTVRTTLAEQLDTLMATVPDATYTALATLRVAVVTDLTTRAARLPELTRITPRTTTPALVLAYALYGDAHREAELVTRNTVRHPGFVPGGIALEVLAK